MKRKAWLVATHRTFIQATQFMMGATGGILAIFLGDYLWRLAKASF